MPYQSEDQMRYMHARHTKGGRVIINVWEDQREVLIKPVSPILNLNVTFVERFFLFDYGVLLKAIKEVNLFDFARWLVNIKELLIKESVMVSRQDNGKTVEAVIGNEHLEKKEKFANSVAIRNIKYCFGSTIRILLDAKIRLTTILRILKFYVLDATWNDTMKLGKI